MSEIKDFAYTVDGEVILFGNTGEPPLLSGKFNYPEDVPWGVFNKDYYSAPGGVLTPMTPEEKEAYDVQKAKDDKLIADLQAVDDWVLSEQSKTFTYDGHNYYPDERSLNAMLTSMEYKPAEFTKEWKTADKEVDGISNVYVVLNKTEITELALTLEQRQSQIWDEGDAKKKLIKEEYNQ